MHKVACVIAVLVIAVSVVTVTTDAETHAEKKPTFIKGKFALPVNLDVVRKDWAARGYSFGVRPKAKGWSRAEHTHSWNFVTTLVIGRIEFIIDGQRFVVEAGDELVYPANAVISARNLYDGTSEMLSGRR